MFFKNSSSKLRERSSLLLQPFVGSLNIRVLIVTLRHGTAGVPRPDQETRVSGWSSIHFGLTLLDRGAICYVNCESENAPRLVIGILPENNLI